MFVHFFFFFLLFQLTVNCQDGPAVVPLVVEEAKTEILQLMQNMEEKNVVTYENENAIKKSAQVCKLS